VLLPVGINQGGIWRTAANGMGKRDQDKRKRGDK